MSKSALKRVRKAIGLPVCRDALPSYAHPGGYPLVYVFADGGTCCPACANANVDAIDQDIKGKRVWNSHGGWALGAVDVHWEGEPEVCDHCGAEIESAYGPVEAQ